MWVRGKNARRSSVMYEVYFQVLTGSDNFDKGVEERNTELSTTGGVTV
jgi:hypothetical protein